jgi:hypothetical protein
VLEQEEAGMIPIARVVASLLYSIAVLSAFLGDQPLQAATPLTDLGRGYYLTEFQGGLYPNGSNQMPPVHAAAGLKKASAIRPRNTAGNPASNGKYVMLSIGMSNTSQEFCSGGYGDCEGYSFTGMAETNPYVEHGPLVIVNGAKGSRTAEYWDSPTDPDYDRIADEVLEPHGLSELQVQAAWVKVANLAPTVPLPSPDADAFRLVEQMGDIARALKDRYPNLHQVFFSSRIFGGYSHTSRNPEPYAYESGFAVKWLIEAQISQLAGGGIDPLAGNLNYNNNTAPWIAWGPYMWADGMTPRSDGLVWRESDFMEDGVHPSTDGRQKVASLLMNFFRTSAFTQSWFLDRPPGDFNNDGAVDSADFVAWRKGLGTVYTQDHYNLWRQNVGTTEGSGAGSAGGLAVPEPASFVLIMAVIVSAVFGIRLRIGW